MSKERQKARATREAARRLEVEAAARKREKAARRKALVPAVALPKRRRRYGALPTSEILRLVVVFAAMQVVIWFFLPGLAARISIAILTAACMLVYVNTRRSTTR
ncbi:MAG: hypothetical protein JWO12_1735 [Frankiales bacterium]|nr:hypothetical protein [Frankiales bacterium]